MSTDLVTIASHLTPLEGEPLRIRLAYQGIPASLEQAEFVTWFWYLSNAVGGVRVLVPSDQRERALAVLASPEESTSDAQPVEFCPKCAETLVSDWIVCWKCGTAADGTEDLTFFQDDVLPADALRGIRRTPALGPLLVLLIGMGVFSPAILLLVVFSRFLDSTDGSESDNPPGDPADLTPDTDASEAVAELDVFSGDAHCACALSSALFGIGFLGLFTLYSQWIVMTIDFNETPASRRGRRWWYVALFLNMLMITMILLVLTLFLVGADWFDSFYYLLEVLRLVIMGQPPL